MNAHQIYQTHFSKEIRRQLREHLASGVLLEKSVLLARERFMPLLEELKPDHSCLFALSTLLIKNGPPVQATRLLSQMTMGDEAVTALMAVLAQRDSNKLAEALLSPRTSPQIVKYSEMTARVLFEELKKSRAPAHQILGHWRPPEGEPKTCFEKLLEYHVFETFKYGIMMHRIKHEMPLPGTEGFLNQN